MKKTFVYLVGFVLSGCSSWQYAGLGLDNFSSAPNKVRQKYRIRCVEFASFPTADLIKASQIPGAELAIQKVFPEIFTRNIEGSVPVDVYVRSHEVRKEGFWTDIPKFLTFCIIPSVKHTEIDFSVDVLVRQNGGNMVAATSQSGFSMSVDSRYANMPWGLASFDAPPDAVSSRSSKYVAIGFVWTWHDARVRLLREVFNETLAVAVKSAIAKYEANRSTMQHKTTKGKKSGAVPDANHSLRKKDLERLRDAGVLSQEEFEGEMKNIEKVGNNYEIR